MVRRTYRPAMTIAVDLGRKATKQTYKSLSMPICGAVQTGYIYLASYIELRWMYVQAAWKECEIIIFFFFLNQNMLRQFF